MKRLPLCDLYWPLRSYFFKWKETRPHNVNFYQNRLINYCARDYLAKISDQEFWNHVFFLVRSRGTYVFNWLSFLKIVIIIISLYSKIFKNMILTNIKCFVNKHFIISSLKKRNVIAILTIMSKKYNDIIRVQIKTI